MDIYFYDLLVVFIAVAATTWWSKVFPLHIFYARKALHILAISACAHAISITNSETYQPFIFLLTAFSILLFFRRWVVGHFRAIVSCLPRVSDFSSPQTSIMELHSLGTRS